MQRRITSDEKHKNWLLVSGIVSPMIGIVVVIFVLHNSQLNETSPTPIYIAEYDTIEVPVPAHTVAAGTPFKRLSLKK